MSFNDIAIHDGCVAGLNLERDVVLFSERCPVLNVFNLDGEAVLAHVLAPAATAASGGFPVNGYQRFTLAICWLVCCSWAACNQQQNGYKSE
jgi:hypothetical protein